MYIQKYLLKSLLTYINIGVIFDISHLGLGIISDIILKLLL